MNERIRELWRDCVLKHTNNPMNWQTFADEFAELIVQECAEVCHKLAEGSDSYVVHDGDTCAEQIKKHFGVE